ncbi:MAG TPA: cytochrome c peroxidase [Archangium sp.]
MTAGVMVALVALAAAPEEARARAFAEGFRRPAPLASPAPAEVALGRLLFFDPRLSRSGTLSCATCHNPALSWGDGLPRALGHGMKPLARRTPTILDVAWGGPFMWDGRFETLEQQALGPLTSPDEMNLQPEEVLAKVNAVEHYRAAFARTFPGEGVTLGTIGRALAAFERTVVSGRAPFDRWVDGETTALSDAARRGFVLFNTRAGCVKCHAGWRFTDDSFHDVGLAGTDVGRGALPDFTELTALQHAFKTPTLRDAERRAPYFHDGSIASLEQVIDLYDAGGVVRRPSLADEMKPLRLTRREKQDLVEFLASLSAPSETNVPVLPRDGISR